MSNEKDARIREHSATTSPEAGCRGLKSSGTSAPGKEVSAPADIGTSAGGARYHSGDYLDVLRRVVWDTGWLSLGIISMVNSVQHKPFLAEPGWPSQPWLATGLLQLGYVAWRLRAR